MSETWQIALVTLALTGIAATIGWIGTLLVNILSGIRADITKKVDKEDCDHSMDRHCDRIDTLVTQVQQNTADINALKERL